MISDFKDKEYTFDHIAEMLIVTIADKLDTTYDFFIKHNMWALKWKLNAMIDKDKRMNRKLPVNCTHPLNRKLESYRV